MAKNNALNFNLPSADDLFSTEESRAEARLEKVINLNPSEISDFPNHPFKVRMDAAMQEMTESVKQYGVLVPALVRPKPDGGYEMVAGHRRKRRRSWQTSQKSPVSCGSSPTMKPRSLWWIPTCKGNKSCPQKRRSPTK